MTPSRETPVPTVLADLRDNPRNPRRIAEPNRAGLARSMEAFGDLSGLVFNVRTGQLVSGHQRKDLLPPDAHIEDYRDAPDATGTVGYGVVHAAGGTWSVRFVDWDEPTEKAANLAANNPHLAGTFTPDVRELLAELEEEIPDIYDQTLLGKILEDVEADDARQPRDSDAPPEYDLSPMPYENYNYVVLLFKNEIDWASAMEHFQLTTVKDPKNPKRVGLGRVIDGAAYLNRQLEHLWKTPASPSSSPPANAPS